MGFEYWSQTVIFPKSKAAVLVRAMHYKYSKDSAASCVIETVAYNEAGSIGPNYRLPPDTLGEIYFKVLLIHEFGEQQMSARQFFDWFKPQDLAIEIIKSNQCGLLRMMQPRPFEFPDYLKDAWL